MRRLRIFAPAVAVAAFAAVIIAGAASAQNGNGNGGNRNAPGVLEASGDGIAAAAGKLTLELCADEGLLLTKGSVEIDEGGYEETVGWLGLNVYFGFSGCATVGPEESFWSFGGNGGGGDRKTAALVVGTGLTLRAEGTGIALLKGEGTWEKDNGDSGAWTDDEPLILKIGGKTQRCDVAAMHGDNHKKDKCATATPEPDDEPDDDDDDDDDDAEPTATPTDQD